MTKKATAVKGRSLRQILLRRILALSAVTLIILSGIMTMLLCVCHPIGVITPRPLLQSSMPGAISICCRTA